jgi:hypothetical protein
MNTHKGTEIFLTFDTSYSWVTVTSPQPVFFDKLVSLWRAFSRETALIVTTMDSVSIEQNNARNCNTTANPPKCLEKETPAT